MARVGAVGGDPVGDAAGEHPGLARAGPGEDAQGGRRGRDGEALSLVEVGDDPGGVHGRMVPAGCDRVGRPWLPVADRG